MQIAQLARPRGFAPCIVLIRFNTYSGLISTKKILYRKLIIYFLNAKPINYNFLDAESIRVKIYIYRVFFQYFSMILIVFLNFNGAWKIYKNQKLIKLSLIYWTSIKLVWLAFLTSLPFLPFLCRKGWGNCKSYLKR